MKKNNKKKLSTNETLEIPIKINKLGIVYQNPFFSIEKFNLEFKKFFKEFYISNYGKKSGILVIYKNKFLFVRQYRFLSNKTKYEIPGGKANIGESFKTAAIRECYEETGIKCLKMKKLIYFNPDNEYTINPTTVFVAKLKNQTENYNLDSKKIIWLSKTKILQLIKNNTISDTLSIMSLLSYSLKNNKK